MAGRASCQKQPPASRSRTGHLKRGPELLQDALPLFRKRSKPKRSMLAHTGLAMGAQKVNLWQAQVGRPDLSRVERAQHRRGAAGSAEDCNMPLAKAGVMYLIRANRLVEIRSVIRSPSETRPAD